MIMFYVWFLWAAAQNILTWDDQTRYIKEHYNYVIISAMASQITSPTIVYSTVYPGADQRKHQTSLAFLMGIHQWPVNSPHKGPVARKMLPFGDVIMKLTGSRPASIMVCLIAVTRYIWHPQDITWNHRPHSRQVTGARCTEIAARQSWAEYSSRPTTDSRHQGWAIKDFFVLCEMLTICEQPLYGIILMILHTNKSSVLIRDKNSQIFLRSI